jgi:hypothetical protein
MPFCFQESAIFLNHLSLCSICATPSDVFIAPPVGTKYAQSVLIYQLNPRWAEALTAQQPPVGSLAMRCLALIGSLPEGSVDEKAAHVESMPLIQVIVCKYVQYVFAIIFTKHKSFWREFEYLFYCLCFYTNRVKYSTSVLYRLFQNVSPLL